MESFDNSKHPWYRFTADNTMQLIEKLFVARYEGKPLNGVIQIFNLFIIRYRFYPGLQVTFDKKTVNIRFDYKKNNGFSIADYNNPDEKKARNLQVINELPQN